MPDSLYRAWRIFATGLCFLVFGIGGLLLGLVIFPMLALLCRRPDVHRRAVRQTIRGSFRVFAALMWALGIIRYDVAELRGFDERGRLVLANHPTLIDVVLLYAFVPHADCVVRGGLARNPFTRGPIRAAGFITNDSGPALIDDCIRSIAAGNNLIIFPEGSRTPTDGRLRRLQRGAANIAVRGQCIITPVIIDCSHPMLRKHEPWYRVPAQRTHYRFRRLPEMHGVHPTTAGEDAAPARAARALTRQLADLFSTETYCHVGT